MFRDSLWYSMLIEACNAVVMDNKILVQLPSFARVRIFAFDMNDMTDNKTGAQLTNEGT
jgi:hypothetical protein